MFTWSTLRAHRFATVSTALALICVIGGLDFVLPRGIPLLLAYILPIALMGSVSSRIWTVIAALVCTGVSEWTDAYVWNIREGTVRDFVTLIAFTAVGLYVREFVTKQESEHLHMKALSDENAGRIEAEEQLTLLIGNSALAILTMTDDGTVVQANETAKRIFLGHDESGDAIVGLKVSSLLPSLARVMARSAEGRTMRTMMQAQGVRLDGDIFLAEVWFANYSTSLGRRTSAMVVDISEEFRSREESVAEQLLSNSRLTLGAMAHEMRNLFGATQLVLQALAQESPEVSSNANVEALRELLLTLEKMASVQLSQVKRNIARISLNQFLTELRVIAQAILSENNIRFVWEVEENLPSVWADTEGLMQVFLNLLRNATTALRGLDDALVCIGSSMTGPHIEITVRDNGPGVADAQKLFHPFQGDGPVNGLGLYLSRALVNSFRGDLRFVASEEGAQFVVELEVAKG